VILPVLALGIAAHAIPLATATPATNVTNATDIRERGPLITPKCAIEVAEVGVVFGDAVLVTHGACGLTVELSAARAGV
jgi:hypothetical protein